MSYDFAERLEFSRGIDCHFGIQRHLLDSIPGAEGMVRARSQDDRNGVDYWINRCNGRPLSLDFKHRSFDPIDRFGSDDICIETCSVYHGTPRPPFSDEQRYKIGWTLNEQKRTDLIVYTWPANGERRRFWIAYFPHLCAASQRHADDWTAAFGERVTPNRGYVTLNVYVPRSDVEAAIRQLTEGVA